MSFKKSKLDLLVRVRYSNPLPAPPCPPKLLDIPTNPMRYARPEFLNTIANETPLPMIVDAECGMPLDLGKWESLWEEDADQSALNPDPNRLPTLDPRDEFLLEPPTAASGSHANGGYSGSGTGSAPTSSGHVPWLRKTEYISREGAQRGLASQEPKHNMNKPIDVSRTAQIRDIEASFAACNNADVFDLKSLKHPNKPHVTAVESYEIFPDAHIWANAYDLFRFSERPGERAVDVEDPRLDCAILRPMESDGDHFLAYYLTKDDESAVAFKENRLEKLELGTADPAEPDQSTAFQFVRDYETVKVEQQVPNEFLLVLDDGESEPALNGTVAPPRTKGAYYKNIERKMILKKKRANLQEAYQDKWEVVNISHVAMDKDEEDEREEALAEVADPLYIDKLRGMADAEGEVDASDAFPFQLNGGGNGSHGDVDVTAMET